MALNKKNDYFDMMTKLAGFCGQAAEKLHGCLTSYSAEKLDAQKFVIHEIEHAADEAKHEVHAKLVREFITPIERDDILALIAIIDDVTDAVDDVAIKLYMYDVKSVPDGVIALSECVCHCAKALESVMRELHAYKKPAELHKLIVELNRLESEADRIYIDAMRLLFTSGMDAVRVVSLKEIYDCLENCCDLCEHAADIVESTVMKNS